MGAGPKIDPVEDQRWQRCLVTDYANSGVESLGSRCQGKGLGNGYLEDRLLCEGIPHVGFRDTQFLPKLVEHVDGQGDFQKHQSDLFEMQ